MVAIKYLSILPFLFSLAAAADCYDEDRSRSSSGLANWALGTLKWDGKDRRCTYATGGHVTCKACYRTQGQPRRFIEAAENIRGQCLGGGTTYEQGYWEADGLRVCFDCANSGHCNDKDM
ncbi:hypothetical protein TWF694_000860 [Orbilia ellipsospora]|uniref:Uncharacterized protein n=1 Tax=Orbilia ellipsospora TaxID=2528407 RepID=A0AAV9XQ77_9PEZI